MWLLAATTGMRRSELAGVRRDMLDLKTGVLRVEDTRVVVAGRSHHSDGKTAAGRRGISLDTFTCAELGKLLDRAQGRPADVHLLADPAYWGREIDDGRYLVVSPR